MGIFINMAISKSVTREEWEKVYGETLQLIKEFPFAEIKTVKIHDIDTTCLVRTEEHEEQPDWDDEEVWTGWSTDGDYYHMRMAEEYCLSRDLVDDTEIEEDAPDAMIGVLPAYLDYGWDDERFTHVYKIWGAKTQGEPYHMYLLAIAALIEARLGTKAFTYGDVTRGQFKKAAELANQFLDDPIDMPDRCYMDRFLKRVVKLPLPEEEQLAAFETFYLGSKDAEFGKYMRQTFSEDAFSAYWKKRFKHSSIGTIGFNNIFNDYMLWGFSLDSLCKYVNFYDEDGNARYDDFVERVMDAKLHLRDKNCKDILKIDQEEEHPYSIATLFAQFAFAGAQNKKVDRFIPIEEIRRELTSCIGNKCNVDEIIDSYLEEEAKQKEIRAADDLSDEEFKAAVDQDPAEVFNQLMGKKMENLEKRFEDYDISEYEQLKFYEPGDTIHPTLLESVGKSRKFLDSIPDEEAYRYLMNKDAHCRCEWLVEQNQYLLIRDLDWEKVFTDIEENEDSFRRYYSLFRVKMSSNALIDMSIAFMINDEFYSYSGKIATH